MKTILEAGDLHGKKVFLRVDWNVPIADGKIVDSFRIEKSLPTIEYLQNAGAKLVLATHFSNSLHVEPVYRYAKSKGLDLLPNLRENPGEEGNSDKYARELASIADIYVNEAFSASHRKHASIVSLPKLLPSFIGLQFKKEVDELSKAFNPSHPFFFILGGAKFETKIPLVQKFLAIADKIFIGGANAAEAINMPLAQDPKVIFPVGDIGALDAFEETLSVLEKNINESEFILWNGPLGFYEKGYKEGTHRLAQMIANTGKASIIGGADTVAAVSELNIFDKFSFVSTGGGAMLDFLASGTLPGIEALGDLT